MALTPNSEGFRPEGEPEAEGVDLVDAAHLGEIHQVGGQRAPLVGEERQRGFSAQMVFSIPMLLSYISNIMTLEPGDLVATGTPSGVGKLAPGDVVEVEIEGISRVSNPVTEGT